MNVIRTSAIQRKLIKHIINFYAQHETLTKKEACQACFITGNVFKHNKKGSN